MQEYVANFFFITENHNLQEAKEEFAMIRSRIVPQHDGLLSFSDTTGPGEYDVIYQGAEADLMKLYEACGYDRQSIADAKQSWEKIEEIM